MLRVELLQQLLNVKDKDLQKIDVDQLRVMLGVFRYLVRGVEREINRRCCDQSMEISPFKNESSKDRMRR